MGDGCWSTARTDTQLASVCLINFYYSAIAWYRDYASYCGLAEDGMLIPLVQRRFGNGSRRVYFCARRGHPKFSYAKRRDMRRLRWRKKENNEQAAK